MPVRILAAIPGFKSEMISGLRDASPGPPVLLGLEAKRITKIRALSDLLRRNGVELAIIAHRLGRELMALREESLHGQWEKRFDTDLAFITKRHANNCIALAQAFKDETGMTGLTLTEALRVARYMIRNISSPTRPAPADAGRTCLRRLRAFKGHLDRTDLSEIGSRLPARDRAQAIEYWIAIVRVGNEAIAQLKRLSKDSRNQPPAGCPDRPARPSQKPEISPAKQTPAAVPPRSAGLICSARSSRADKKPRPRAEQPSQPTPSKGSHSAGACSANDRIIRAGNGWREESVPGTPATRERKAIKTRDHPKTRVGSASSRSEFWLRDGPKALETGAAPAARPARRSTLPAMDGQNRGRHKGTAGPLPHKH